MRKIAAWFLPVWCGLALVAAQEPEPPSTAASLDVDPGWILESHSIDEPFRPYLGNGYMGVKVAGEGTNAGPGGQPAGQHFVAGVYLEDPEIEESPARESISATPMWSKVQLEWGRAAFHRGSGEVTDYRQTLDMRRGLLRTACTWRTEDQDIAIDVQFLISRDDPHVGAIRYSIVPGSDGSARFRVGIEGKDLGYDAGSGPASSELEQRARGGDPDGRVAWLGTENSLGIRMGNALAVAFEGGESKLVSRMGDRVSGQTVYFTAEAGRRYTLDVFASVHTSLDADDPVGASRRGVLAARDLGWDEVLARHETRWDEIWRTDIVVEGEDVLEDQRRIRANLFQLLQSMRDEGDRVGLGPAGLSDGYDFGWISWEADYWAWTPIALLHSDFARPLLDFRYRTIDEARRSAERQGYDGLKWPAIASAYSGREQGSGEELHTGGWVAFAHWNHYLLTRDPAWLREHGWPVIRGTADFWRSRATWDEEEEHYELRGVVPPRAREVVDGCAVTTALARQNLSDAILAAERLGETPDPRWRQVADGLHPSNEGDASGLTIFPIARPLDEPEAWREYQRHLEQGLRGPFLAWAESDERPAWSSLLAGAGSSLQQVLFGFAGVRIRNEGIVVTPALPPGWTGLRLTGVGIGTGVYDIVIDGDGRPSATLVGGVADVPILDGEGGPLVAPR